MSITTTRPDQAFIRLFVVPPGGSVSRLTVDQQKARWLSAHDTAVAFREALAKEAALRNRTQLERHDMPRQHCIELSVTGPAPELARVLWQVRHAAELQGVTVVSNLPDYAPGT